MTNFKEITETILSCYSDWIINSISFLSEGDFCSAYFVNNEWLFHFAKHEEAQESLQQIELLDEQRNLLEEQRKLLKILDSEK